MGVVLPEDVTNDGGALAVGGGGADAHLVEGVEDAALDGLEAIAHVREGALDDDGHRIVQVGGAHLLLDAPVADIAEAGVSGH